MRTDRNLILEKVDLLLAEAAELRARGPYFRIYHRFHRPSLGLRCAPGEEISAVCLVYRGKECRLPLSLSLRILFDYLARHSRLPQSAAQIEAGIRADPFSMQHAANAMRCGQLTRKLPRSYVRVYIERMRVALERAFSRAKLPLDTGHVLFSERTVMNEAGYQLRATFSWTHLNGNEKCSSSKF